MPFPGNFASSLTAILLLATLTSVQCLEYSELLVVILSQEESYNAAQANSLKLSIIKEAKQEKKDPPQILLSHTLDVYGSWTIAPIFAYLSSQNSNASWYIVCTEFSVVRLKLLKNLLQRYDVEAHRNLWLGHALHDREPSIIHHYADHSKRFKYPNLSSGFAVTKYLFRRISKRALDVNRLKTDFSIDPAYEFATFVVEECKGSRLTHNPAFCSTKSEECVIYPRNMTSCAKPVPVDNIYLAVKTCIKNYYERLVLIKESWTKYAVHRGFFTDVQDQSSNDSILVPNTEHGHCEKTLSILKHVEPILSKNNIDWLLITDDDTILSLSRLLNFLSCYDPKKPVIIGERYGYRTGFIHGYDYLTGGAGVVLSAPLVQQIVAPGVCDCPTSSTPDDMFLFGVCVSHLSVKTTHSPSFHQARPFDYPPAYLESHTSISFHKFWMSDPLKIYGDWFSADDGLMFNTSTKHEEL